MTEDAAGGPDPTDHPVDDAEAVEAVEAALDDPGAGAEVDTDPTDPEAADSAGS